MIYKNYTAYDDDEFFKKYIQKREKGNAPNELIEQPIFDELLGQVQGKKILDLGCGDGKYGFELMNRGARQYEGLEGSQKMVALAKKHLQGLSATVEAIDIEHKKYNTLEYDFVISRLVLHYIQDLENLLKKVNKCLKEEGIFIFSVEHPIITSSYESYHQKTKRGNWIVDDYFHSGERVNVWMGKNVVKYHRTFEEYWNMIKASNFEITTIRESKPQQSNFEQIEEYQRRMRIPLFLFFKLKKK